MAYQKQEWHDLPLEDTPISADRLNHIEQGIYDNSIKTDVVNSMSDWERDKSPSVSSVKYYLKGTILWENESPTNNFEAQNITLSSSDYDFYEVYCSYNKQSSSLDYINGYKSIKGKGMLISENGFSSDVSTRRKIDYVSDTSLSISGGYAGSNQDDSYLIPRYVIGYKTGTFDE